MHIVTGLVCAQQAGGGDVSAVRWMVEMLAYLQPIAQHVAHPERLLLRGEDGRFFVWFGGRAGAEPVEIEPPTAAWMYRQAELSPLPSPLIWLHVADLPVDPVPTATPQDRPW